MTKTEMLRTAAAVFTALWILQAPAAEPVQAPQQTPPESAEQLPIWSPNRRPAVFGIHILEPVFVRPWMNSFLRTSDSELELVTGHEFVFDDLDDSVEKASGFPDSLAYNLVFPYCSTLGDNLAENRCAFLKLSLLEYYERILMYGIDFSLTSADSANVYGLAYALLGNTDDLRGIQLMPLFAVSNRKMAGLQCSAFGSYSKSGRGMQIGGWGSMARGFKGIQIAGAGSFALEESSGFQISGLVCKAGTLNGAQIAGIGCLDFGTTSGTQISGLANHSDTLRGAQISLLENSARTASGLQIGLYNTADEGSNVLQIGLLCNVGDARFHWLPFFNFKFR